MNSPEYSMSLANAELGVGKANRIWFATGKITFFCDWFWQTDVHPARARCVYDSLSSMHYPYCVWSPTGPCPIACASVCPIASASKQFSWGTQIMITHPTPGTNRVCTRGYS